jgi:hypothetical protein
MERCQTILPPRPPPLTTFRASLGALWFRASSAVRGALQRASRPPRRARLSAPENEPCTPILVSPAYDDSAPQRPLQQETPEDDRWLRPTEVLPLH